MTVNDVVKRARTRLGDSKSTGWDDSTLIDYVDQAQKDLCKTARVYKRTLYLGLINNQLLYPLPQDCFQVDRAEYQGEPLSVLSREDQDIRHLPKGLHIIKSDLNMQTLEISEPFTELDNYAAFHGSTITPDGEHDPYTDPQYGVVVSENSPNLMIETPYGVTVGLELDTAEAPDTFYGDISSFDIDLPLAITAGDNQGVLIMLDGNFGVGEGYHGFLNQVDDSYTVGTYGVCTDALSSESYLKVYYSSKASTVNSLYDALVVDDIWERALVHYVVGMARQDDNDESNNNIGERELKKYDDEVKKAKKLSARAYSSTVQEIKETTYRRL